MYALNLRPARLDVTMYQQGSKAIATPIAPRHCGNFLSGPFFGIGEKAPPRIECHDSPCFVPQERLEDRPTPIPRVFGNQQVLVPMPIFQSFAFVIHDKTSTAILPF